MAKKADKKEYATRFGMGVLAMLFLVTSVGFSVLVIWQVRQQHKQESSQTKVEASMLKGTKLQNFTPTSEHTDKIEITDIVEGVGEVVGKDATITAHYTGALVSNGVIFESSIDSGQPFTSPLSGLISGWQEGLPGMKGGGTRRLVIPYAQAYGAEGRPPSIPPNADLVFDIQVLSFNN